MATEPRKHHYVPQSILRNFSIDGERRNVFVFDKALQRSFASPILDAGAERNFYRVHLGAEELNYESFFDRLDCRLAELLTKVLDSESLLALSAEERSDLAMVTACQLLRTKLQRTSPIDIARQLAQRFQDEGMESPGSIADSDARFLSFQRLLDFQPIIDLLASKDILLITVRDAKLWTSDNPIVFHNNFPNGRPALAAPGVEIYYPLSSHLCLGFLCPSIKQSLEESSDSRHPMPASRDSLMLRLLKSLREQTPLESSEDYSLFLNSMQIRQSSRFLYNSENDFKQAKQAISKHPHLGDVQSLVTVGPMGALPPPDPRIPPGTWLHVETGNRQYMIAVGSVDESSWTIDFTTTDIVKLALVEQSAPFNCVTLIKNGQQTRMLRDVVFCHLEHKGSRFVRVQHSDAAMNTLMEKINQKTP